MSALDLSAAKALAARAIAAALADANTAEAVSGTANNDQEMLDDQSEVNFDDDEPMVTEEAVAGELTSNSSREVFVAYLEEKHPLLVPLFPADSSRPVRRRWRRSTRALLRWLRRRRPRRPRRARLRLSTPRSTISNLIA